MNISDVRNVEYRMAQISGEKPVQAARPSLPSVSAFTALLGVETSSLEVPVGRAPLAPAKLERLIADASTSSGTDPALVKAIVANESGFDPLATSPAGAQGLMQLMPVTAAENGVRDPYDAAQNVAGGTRYFARLLTRFNGDVPTALAAYNAGPEAVDGGKLPAETQTYVRSVLASYAQYRAAKPT